MQANEYIDIIKKLPKLYMLKKVALIIKQLYLQLKFIIKIVFLEYTSKNNLTKNLAKDGYLIIKNFIEIEDIQNSLRKDSLPELLKDIDPTTGEKVETRKVIEIEKLLISKLSNKSHISRKILDLLISYVGKDCITYANGILIIPEKEIKDGSWQPHHDSKFNRLKIYLWISPKSTSRHPFYFLRGSHKHLKWWTKYSDTRFSKIKSKNMFTNYPDTGDLIIFDTHGLHSHLKRKGLSRSVFSINLDPLYGISQIKDLCTRLNGKFVSLDAEKIIISP